jgi:PhnB protein
MKAPSKSRKSKSVKAVPKGFHNVTPFLMVDNASGLIEFMQKAFDGKVTSNMKMDNGNVMHATVRIGDSEIMVADVMDRATQQPMPTMLYLYVDDVDAMYEQALSANASSIRVPTDEFYGDRSAGIKDEWNNQWWLATHKEDVSDEEMERRKEEFLSKSKEEHVTH